MFTTLHISPIFAAEASISIVCSTFGFHFLAFFSARNVKEGRDDLIFNTFFPPRESVEFLIWDKEDSIGIQRGYENISCQVIRIIWLGI